MDVFNGIFYLLLDSIEVKYTHHTSIMHFINHFILFQLVLCYSWMIWMNRITSTHKKTVFSGFCSCSLLYLFGSLSFFNICLLCLPSGYFGTREQYPWLFLWYECKCLSFSHTHTRTLSWWWAWLHRLEIISELKRCGVDAAGLDLTD